MAYIEWLHRGRLDRQIVGGKGASLSDLASGGFLVPAGFCISADAYRHFVEANALTAAIDSEKVLAAKLPEELQSQIGEAYDELVSMSGVACAVRSSSISEDGTITSYAGLYESYLNVIGLTPVLECVVGCYASLWSERAADYRGGQTDADEAMAVVVMGLVPSEASGIAFTAHPVTGDQDQVVINASWGLGEAIVSGLVNPDSFVVSKSSLRLVEREIFAKQVAVYPHPDGGGTLERQLPRDQARAPCLSDEMVLEVAQMAARVEKHYGTPQDVEWGMAGGQIYVLQSRPITTL